MLQGNGWYQSNSIADQVVFLYTFMPILRHEINIFIETHNDYPIRMQHGLHNHISGKPSKLWTKPPGGRQFGLPPDHPLAQEMLRAIEAVSNCGTYLKSKNLAAIG